MGLAQARPNNYNNKYYVHKVGGASKQLTISGWGEHDVRISVPFTRDCYVFGTLAMQA